MAVILEVVVGLGFVIILLSIVVTEVNTFVSRVFRLRARNLRSAINSLIEDPVVRAKVVTHPLIQLVKAEAVAPTQRITRDEAEAILRSRISGVDRIEPSTFVDVVLSTVKAESDQRLYGALATVVNGMPAGRERRSWRSMLQSVMRGGGSAQDLRQSLRDVQDRRTRTALAQAVNQLDDELSLSGAQGGNAALMASLRQVQDEKLRNVLATVFVSSQSMPDARASLENWFNAAMARASAAYTTKMKLLSLIVALTFALLVNIDALHIARTLWDDPAQRAQISDTAAYNVQSGALGEQVGGTDSDDIPRASDADSDSQLEDAVEAGANIVAQLEDLESLSLPIGWRKRSLDHLPADHSARRDPTNLWNYLPENNPQGWQGLLALKLLGIAATALAAAQGAPFWFGIVSKVLRR